MANGFETHKKMFRQWCKAVSISAFGSLLIVFVLMDMMSVSDLGAMFWFGGAIGSYYFLVFVPFAVKCPTCDSNLFWQYAGYPVRAEKCKRCNERLD